MILAGLCAVTPEESNTEKLVALIEKVLDGGAAIIQYRCRKLSPDDARMQAGAVAEIVRRYGRILLIQDDWKLARAIGATGAYVAAAGDAVEAVRESAKHLVLGAYCGHRLELAQAAKEEGANFVAFGSAFPQRGKPDIKPVPLSILKDAKAMLGLPVCAVGGINPSNAHEVVEAGADIVSVSSALFKAPDITAAALSIAAQFEPQ